MSPPLSWRARVREKIESNDLMFFMPIGPTSDREASGTTMPERDDYVMFYTVYGECFPDGLESSSIFWPYIFS